MVRADSTTIGTCDQPRTRRITFSPSLVGQPQVDQQQVRLVAACLDLGALRGVGFDAAVAVRLEQHAQHPADVWLVLDDQQLVHRLGHGVLSVHGRVKVRRAPPPGRRCASISPP